ncbi:variant erythrocyte surface antigen-1 family protein [Babesia caballi]|uniref:Variant erythrocyte surface antigen-1 family protein n=1 Tax=Babesia caballi TaxID=5871 RepID=A0AAV4M246_BABCB|nr:variant erythrocyte surface antigen-1 family protein [Babesia caballi]
MSEKKSKLTDWPENLKDVIDWFLRVGGKDSVSTTDKGGALKNAVYQLEGKDVLENALGNGNLEGLFGSVAKGLQSFIGYDTNGTHEFTGNGIAAKSGYTSSYSKEAQWDGQLNQPNSEDAKKAAILFLCYMPLLYLSLIYLYWKCTIGHNYGGWGSYSLHRTNDPLGLFMSAMGFKINELQNKSGSEVSESLTRDPDGFGELQKAPKNEYYFSSYLGKVSEYGQSEISKPASCPLYALYKASTTYLMSRYTDTEETDQTMLEIKQKLQAFYISFNSDQDLKGEISNFISTCMSVSKQSEAHPPSGSPAGPVAGTLSTLGLGGGAAAAYMFNLGGAKTLINGILKIAITALTEQVRQLLDEVKDVGAGLGHQEFQKVIQALKAGGSGSTGLIGKLADGLQQFIGYNGTTFNPGNVGQITGAGIAPSNIATHRLCDATIAFTIGVLEKVRETILKDRQNKEVNKYGLDKIYKAINILHRAYGRGVERFMGTIKIYDYLCQLKVSESSDVAKFVRCVGDIFYTTFHNSIFGSSMKPETLGERVGRYIDAVLKAGGTKQTTDVTQKLQKVMTEGKVVANGTYDPMKSDGEGHCEVDEVQSVLDKAVEAAKSSHGSVKKALLAGTKSFMRELWKENYVSYYDAKATWQGADEHKCAKIFLSCIPLIYHGLTHLSWRCSNNNSWSTLQFNGFGGRGGTLNHFMVGAGYTEYTKLSSSAGGNVMAAVASRLPEFHNVDSSTRNSYTEYLKSLQERFNGTLTPSTGAATLQDQTMPALFFAAQAYFQHVRLSKTGDPKSPTTVRETLYWMAGLPFSPGYGELEKYVGAIVPEGGLYVTNSETKIKGDIITAADMKGYLLTSCLSIPGLLGVIQGSSGSEKEPWLHTLLSNGSNFKYPSGPELFKLLSDYTYALQFQLSFLYNQCRSGYDDGYGWRDCSYGQEANKNPNTPMTSFICHADCESKHSTSNAKCEHVKHDGSQCGKQAGKPSPIQAFLTDNLKGFSLPTTTNKLTYSDHHMTDHPPGALCHVKMGFTTSTIKAGRNPVYHIYVVLEGICGGSASPLRQLYETLTCLTKRVPKSLSDWFGFYWYLVGTWDRGSGQSRLSVKQAIQNTAEGVIGSYCGAMTQLIDVIHGLVRHCHNTQSGGYNIEHTPPHSPQPSTFGGQHTCSTTPFDLWSVSNGVHKSRTPDCNKSTANCGGYLSPLTLTESSAFAPSFAQMYLSWIVYLPDEFRVLFEGLREGFKKIVCEDCIHPDGHKCSNESGKHGDTAICKCPSVVQCVGVYGLLYEHGFRFTSAQTLGGKNDETKRSCDKFLTLLSTILSENAPLRSLPEVMETFIFRIRFPFLATIFSLWCLFLMVLVNIFVFRLDLLHFRSHVRLPSSHAIPPVALLTSGKPIPISKLIYFLQ